MTLLKLVEHSLLSAQACTFFKLLHQLQISSRWALNLTELETFKDCLWLQQKVARCCTPVGSWTLVQAYSDEIAVCCNLQGLLSQEVGFEAADP